MKLNVLDAKLLIARGASKPQVKMIEKQLLLIQ
jgi:hypothetical protein